MWNTEIKWRREKLRNHRKGFAFSLYTCLRMTYVCVLNVKASFEASLVVVFKVKLWYCWYSNYLPFKIVCSYAAASLTMCPAATLLPPRNGVTIQKVTLLWLLSDGIIYHKLIFFFPSSVWMNFVRSGNWLNP